MNITKMKTWVLLFISLTFIASCTSDDDSVENLTNEEAVEIVEASLQKSTAGFNDEVEKLTEETTNNYSINLDCDTDYNENFQRNYTGAVITASYDVSWSYNMTCNAVNVPQTLAFSSSSQGDYTTPRMTSDDISTTTMNLIGLQPTEDNLTFSGTFKREGRQELTVVNTRNVSSSVFIEITDVIVSKETNQIQSGNATMALTGTTNDGQNFTFNGNIVFNGNRMATLILNGETYEIDLN